MLENDAPQAQRFIDRFTPYPITGNFAENLLQEMTCTVLAARAFECFPVWKMRLRQMPNDMFFFIIRGKGRARVGNRFHPLRAGTCLHARSGVPHEIQHDPEDPLHVLVIHYTALLDFALPVPDVLGFSDVFDFENDALARDLLWEICRQHALAPPGWQSGANATALAFLFRLVHQHGGVFHPLRLQRLSDLARISPVIRLMRESLAAPLSMEDYAMRASLSAPQFRRIFQRATGIAPNTYRRRLRLERAAFLLRHTMETIESISQEVGYTEPAFFAKTFKEEMGAAPGAYRKMRDLMDR